MRTIYIDSDFKCHVTNDGTMTAVATDYFEGKCDKFIEGYRYVPEGATWRRPDGVLFRGEMVTPWKEYAVLAAYQKQYEETLAEMDAAYREGVNSV